MSAILRRRDACAVKKGASTKYSCNAAARPRSTDESSGAGDLIRPSLTPHPHTPAARFQNSCNSGDSLPVQPSTRPRAKVRCSSSLENMRLMPSKL